MPIKFRCSHCRQFLGISRSKANTLTDCPTCGRTIRIPDLDGKVAPVPAPKLNLQDSQLRQALGALAGLEQEAEFAPSEKAQQEAAEPLVHYVDQAADVPVVVVEAVEHSPPAVVVDHEVDGKFAGAMSSLSELANEEYAIPIVEPEQSPLYKGLHTGLVLLAGALLFLGGYFTGRQTTQSNSLPEAAKARDVQVLNAKDVDEKNVHPENVAASQTRISGTITYRTSSGEVRIDKGARVLALPIPRQGTSKLSADGFRVGASSLDQEVLIASANALGGRFVLADHEGKFELSNLPPGQYGLLIASRYQAKDDLQLLGKNESNLLEKYFDNSTQVIGMLQSFYQEVTLTEERQLVIDHEFMQ